MSKHLGLGVMIGLLSGYAETADAIKASLGKIIASARLEDDALQFVFTDGAKLRLWDAGQSCCERRYMQTDDDLSRFTGATLLDFELKDAPDIEGTDEVQFLDTKTSLGVFQMASHNVHNGYHGGILIIAAATRP